MNILRRFFILQHEYANPIDRHRARGLLALNRLLMLIAAAAALLSPFFVRADVVITPLLPLMAPLLALVALVSTALVQRGRLNTASYLYVAVFMLPGPLATLIRGVNTAAALLYGLPLVAAGLLLTRRNTAVVALLMATLALVGGIYDIRFIQSGGAEVGLAGIVLVPFIIAVFGLLLYLFAGEFRDLVERLFRAERQGQHVAAISQQLAGVADPNEYLNDACNLLNEHFALQQVRVFLWDEEMPDVLRLHGGTGLLARRARYGEHTVALERANPLGEAFLEGRPVRVTGGDPAPRRVEFWPGAQAELVLPLQADGQSLGVLDVQSADEAAFLDGQTVAALTALASQVAFAAQRVRLLARLDRQEAELDALYEQARQANETIQRLRRQIGTAAWEKFFGGRGVQTVGYDLPPDAAEPVPGEAMTHSAEATLRAGASTIMPTETGCLLCVPILLEEQTLGVMEFEVPGQSALPSRLLDLAETVANRLALALENARLLEQVQATAQREQRISATSAHLQTVGDLDGLLATAAQEFQEALGSVRTHIRLQVGDPAPPS